MPRVTRRGGPGTATGLILVAGLTAIGWLLPIAAAQAFSVNTSPTSAPPGGFVAVALVEAGGVEVVRVELDGKSLVGLRADQGALTTCVPLPAGTAEGARVLRFVGDDGAVATATIQVDPDAAGATSTCGVRTGTPSTSTTSSSTTGSTGTSSTSTATSTARRASAAGNLASTGAPVLLATLAGLALVCVGALLRIGRRRRAVAR